MRKLVTIAIFAISCLCVSGRIHVQETPDFAYPKKVIKTSKKELDKALKTDDVRLLLESVINLTTAETLIDEDSVQICINQIVDAKDKTKNKIGQSLLDLYLAKYYWEIYERRSWIYDRRVLPESYIPDNVYEWSGSIFKNKIKNLIQSCLAPKPELQSMRLRELGDLITKNNDTYIVFPSVYDFVIYNSIKLLMGISNDNVAEISELLDEIIAFHGVKSVSGIYAEIQKIILLNSTDAGIDSEQTLLNISKGLEKLYEERGDEEFSNYILLCLSNLPETIIPRGYLFEVVEKAVSRYPNFSMNSCLVNILSMLKQTEIALSAPSDIVPGDTLRVNIQSSNLNEFTVGLYRLDEGFNNRDFYISTNKNDIKLVSEKKLAIKGKVPFKKDTVITFVVAEPGYYILKTDNDEKEGYYQKINCSNYTTGIITTIHNTAVVVNPCSGEPQEGVEIYYDSSEHSSEKYRSIGLTNNSGMLSLSNTLRGQLSARKGEDVYSKTTYVYPVGEKSEAVLIKGFTSLGVYHPGDNVDWTAIVYSSGGNSSVLSDKEVEVILRDANYQGVDTLKRVTDEFGRLSGKFMIPEDRLTGRYRIEFKSDQARGSVQFMVSDYKLPTFYVEIKSVLSRDFPLEISGISRTFSGMPVAGAEVNVSVSYETGMWRNYSVTEIFNGITYTNFNGDFCIEIPSDKIEKEKRGRYIVNVTVVSGEGESQTAQKSCVLCPGYSIVASIPQNIEIKSTNTLDVKVMDYEGKDTIMPIKMVLLSKDKGENENVCFEKIFNPGEPVSLDNVTSGVYDMELSPISEYGDTMKLSDIGFYRINDDMPPMNSEVIWVPNTKLSNTDKIVYGIYNDDTYVLLTIHSENGIIEQRWLKESKGIKELDIKVRSEDEKIIYTLFSVNRYLSAVKDIAVTNPTFQDGLEVEMETFRTKLIPNEEETWTFKIRSKSGKDIEAAGIIDLYNAALEAVAGNELNFRPVRSKSRDFSIRTPYLGGRIYLNFEGKIKYENCENIEIPRFRVYDNYFLPNGLYPVAINTPLSRATADFAMADEAYEEEILGSAVMTQNAKYDSGGNEIIEDAVVENIESEQDVDSQYRPSEIPLALYEPNLSTDSEGRIELSFTVPNANTTWLLKSIFFSKDLQTGNLSKEFIASKPVMVSANPPRFLRTGDEVSIKASVYNNTDSMIAASTKIEIFNPSTGEVLKDSITSLSIESGGSKNIGINFMSPDNPGIIGYRIKSSVKGATDGEETFLPILPSDTEVLESETFYISRDDSTYTEAFIVPNDSANVLLQYCDNPLWYAVISLPELKGKTSDFATDLAGTIYATVIAENLSERYPIIREALSYWREEGRKDSVLVSNLEKNQELKDFMIQSTPWIGAAINDTERMNSLYLSLDKKYCKESFEKNLKKLEALQREDGGFAWSSNYSSSSEWVTVQILEILGTMNSRGLLTDERLRNIADFALTYIEAEQTKRFDRNKNIISLDFASLCTYFPSYQRSTSGDKLYRASIQHLLKRWKNLNLKEKASAAIVLYRSGYQNVAKNILNSICEYAVTSPQKGIWWANEINDGQGIETIVLEAYSMIEPTSPVIELLVQHLIFMKLKNQWSNNFKTSETIDAILMNCVPSDEIKSTVMINGKRLDENNSRYLGAITDNISDYIVDNQINLNVNKTPGSPIWGALYYQYKNFGDSVHSKASEYLSIEKNVYIIKENKLIDGANYKVGDKVRIVLTINAKENMDYVIITDNRAACMEPVEQLPKPIYCEGLNFYRENSDTSTNIFIDHLPKGSYQLTYDMWLNNSGEYISGVASIQSQYAPWMTAYSSAHYIKVED